MGHQKQESEICEDVVGRKELLYDDVYYDVTNWIKRHPGGKIIEFYTESGEDSTHAVQQFHQRSTKKVMAIMKSLPQRISDKNSPPLNLDPEKTKKHEAMSKDFLELYKELKSEGLFNPDPIHTLQRIVEVLLFFVVGCYLLRLQIQYSELNNISLCYPTYKILAIRILGVLSLTLCYMRTGWIAHETGHSSLTGIPKLDRFIITVLYGGILGLSSSYWIYQHSRHHAMPQHVKYDIDLKTLPLLAFNKKAVKNPKNGKTFFIQNQQTLFLTLDSMLVGLFWKFILHPRYCFHKQRYFDLICMVLHYTVVPYIGLLNYLIALWFMGIYFFGNFSLSHTHLPVTEEPTHWLEYSLLHTANVRSSWWVDYWMGNLNYQIEHHLFPTMPQFKNKLCRDRVKALAKKHNLPYHLFSYKEAVITTWNNLDTVSKELWML